jgi:hypothetical protein
MGMQTIEERNSGRTRRHLPLEKVDAHGDAHAFLHTARKLADEDAWKIDESWTSIIGYMAELSVPGEG